MGFEMKLIKSIRRVQPQKLGLASITAFFLISLALLAVSTSFTGFSSSSILKLRSADSASNEADDAFFSRRPGTENETREISKGLSLNYTTDAKNSSVTVTVSPPKQQEQNKSVHSAILKLRSADSVSNEADDTFFSQRPGTENETREISKGLSLNYTTDAKNSSVTVTVSPPKQQEQNKSVHSAEEPKTSNPKLDQKPVCDFSDPRTDVCEMEGDIRINGNSSSVLFLSSSPTNTTQPWKIKPHPRKGDTFILSKVTNISVSPFTPTTHHPLCTINHTVPAIVFSTGGYMGNAFHDFTDVLIPLFITSRQFNGQVQFLVTEIKLKWNHKYRPFLKHLSHYPILDFNNDRSIHCYPHTIVGLRSHKEMTIDPSRSRYTMADFGRLVRTSFGLARQTSNPLKPRLLIIARSWTRTFKNVDDIVKMAEGLGFEVVVGETKPGDDLKKFARLVNSCDVMMGVHGAGLTNLVFLPTKAVVVQVVPLGKLEGIARGDFGVPAVDLGMSYLEYSISDEESSLVELYPRDHAVFKDPVSIHRQGWSSVSDVYLVKQHVRLDVGRFKETLMKAFELKS